MKPVEHVSTMIIGASMLGLGLASRIGRDALVIEPSNGVGIEFIRSFKLSDRKYAPLTASGIELHRELIRRNVTDEEGRLHLPGMMPVLIKHITGQKLDVRMQTQVVEAQPCDGKFEVVCYDASGFRHIVADRLVDTTSGCVTKVDRCQVKAKCLNMMLLGSPDAGRTEGLSAYALYQGRFPNETVLKYAVDPMDDWFSARSKLFEFWLNRPEPLRSCAFVTHADEFDMEFDTQQAQIQPGWDWLPSAYYVNPLEAYEQGYNLRLGVNGDAFNGETCWGNYAIH
ncbi:hypothetical protein SAMN05216378_0785 [Paenibacillus catalpae]|uniref:Uncharacterized protein n=1 Tax=Paenibacillus catalpae TaxID=1045775 RepID=A0A1I1U828_9BACL|nr:hypothetical protein [Paenibacillus catalpae]SFD64060.1 hypothetical protein SAMN05216378_0785 [Paenibacillus catalpae]